MSCKTGSPSPYRKEEKKRMVGLCQVLKKVTIEVGTGDEEATERAVEGEEKSLWDPARCSVS